MPVTQLVITSILDGTVESGSAAVEHAERHCRDRPLKVSMYHGYLALNISASSWVKRDFGRHEIPSLAPEINAQIRLAICTL